MGKIARWSKEKQQQRREIIGDHIPCPICFKQKLSVIEGERRLVCTGCGARYDKKQRYIKNRMKENKHVEI